MNGPIRRVARILGIVFLLLVLGLTYWQAMAADQLRQNRGNARVELTRSGQERGEIISADTVVLARSVPDREPGSFRRIYLHGSAYAHVVGFSSALFGDRGVEATHASTLRSRRDLTTSGILNAMLGDDLRPHSIQLTLNHEPPVDRRASLGRPVRRGGRPGSHQRSDTGASQRTLLRSQRPGRVQRRRRVGSPDRTPGPATRQPGPSVVRCHCRICCPPRILSFSTTWSRRRRWAWPHGWPPRPREG